MPDDDSRTTAQQSERAIGSTGFRTPGWQAVGLFALLLLASARFAPTAIRRWDLGELEQRVRYQAATLGPNYFEFGAVRRGLGGSIVHLLSPNLAEATVAFHLVFATGLALAIAWLFRRLQVPASARGAFAIIALVIMLQWGSDGGRTDMAVACVLGCTALAFRCGRPGLGAGFVGLGLFIHEASVIFGVPLLAALMMQSRAGSRSDRGQWIAVAGVIGLALGAYAGLNHLPHADPADVAAVVRSKLSPHQRVELALYFALSGIRGVKTSVCQNLTDPSYWVHPFGGLAVMGLTCSALGGRVGPHWKWALLASLPGFVFLSVVANDISRWTMLGCFNIWLLAATTPGRAARSRLRGLAPPGLALAFIPLVLSGPQIIESRMFAPSPLIEAAVRALGGARTPSVEEALDRCDPTWAQALTRN
ncbi:MAG TPA: hypothetical protein VNU71_06315 [Burkholderiaceae bacterium]|nr:hypothetical protein [Burkholderiaceae bacterium]